jgi:hypothetical protein
MIDPMYSVQVLEKGVEELVFQPSDLPPLTKLHDAMTLRTSQLWLNSLLSAASNRALYSTEQRLAAGFI